MQFTFYLNYRIRISERIRTSESASYSLLSALPACFAHLHTLILDVFPSVKYLFIVLSLPHTSIRDCSVMLNFLTDKSRCLSISQRFIVPCIMSGILSSIIPSVWISYAYFRLLYYIKFNIEILQVIIVLQPRVSLASFVSITH